MLPAGPKGVGVAVFSSVIAGAAAGMPTVVLPVVLTPPPVGVTPVAVAVLVRLPRSMSAWVTV